MKAVSTLKILATLVLTLGLLNGACINKKKPKSSGGGGVGPGGVDTEKVITPSFGIMNFRQLAASYEMLTGVTLANNAVNAEYESLLASLPKNFDPSSMSASKVSAATKLAAIFCDTMSQNNNLLTTNFGADINTLASQDPNELATSMLTRFFGPPSSIQGDRAEDTAIVSKLITDLRAIPNATPPAVVMGTCAAIISSAEIYLF